jgi:Uma2 family endonuclease
MAEILQEPYAAGHPDIGIITGRGIRADGGHRRKRNSKARPGWIPPHILHGWDPDPYAYQTEEEMMPAGGPHGEMLAYLAENLKDFLKIRGMRSLPDTFMLYFDKEGTEQRIGPDLLIMPFRSPAPPSYDATKEPPPYAVAEITSPKSRKKDLEDNVAVYTEQIGIPAYLVIDMFTARRKLRKKPELHLWRRTEHGIMKMNPDSEGWFRVPEAGIKIKAQKGGVLLADADTGEMFMDSGELKKRAEAEAELRKKETERAEQEKQRAEQEAELRKKETERAEQEAELRKKETERAEQEKQRAEQEAERAERLAAKLRELGISPD